jgi:hypothetical protein
VAEIFLFPLGGGGGGKEQKSTSRSSDFFPTVNFSTTALAAPFPPSLFTAWYISAIAMCGRAGWKERYRKSAPQQMILMVMTGVQPVC